jgi:tetratricopeptide (TPR) repeat protein
LRKQAFLTLLVVLPFFCSAARTPIIDSLTNLLENDKRSDKFLLNCLLSLEYSNLSDPVAVTWAQNAMEIACGSDYLTCRALRVKGIAYLEIGDYFNALVNFKQGFAIAEKCQFSLEAMRLANMVGLVEIYFGHYAEASTYLYKSLDFKTDANDGGSNESLLNNLGLLYYKLGNYVKAGDYYNQAFSIRGSAISGLNLALAYIYTNQFDKADVLIGKISSFPGPKGQSKLLESFARGLLFHFMKQETLSSHHFGHALRMSKQLCDERYEAECLYYLGVNAKLLGDSKEALVLLNASKAKARDLKNPVLELNALNAMIQIHLDNRDVREVIRRRDELISRSNALSPMMLSREMALLEVCVLEAENNTEIQLQRQKLEAKERLDSGMTIIAAMSGVVLGGIFMIVGVLCHAIAMKNAHSTVLRQLNEQRLRAEDVLLRRNGQPPLEIVVMAPGK